MRSLNLLPTDASIGARGVASSRRALNFDVRPPHPAPSAIADASHRRPTVRRPKAAYASPQRGEVTLGHDRAAVSPLPCGERSRAKRAGEGEPAARLRIDGAMQRELLNAPLAPPVLEEPVRGEHALIDDQRLRAGAGGRIGPELPDAAIVSAEHHGMAERRARVVA